MPSVVEFFPFIGKKASLLAVTSSFWKNSLDKSVTCPLTSVRQIFLVMSTLIFNSIKKKGKWLLHILVHKNKSYKQYLIFIWPCVCLQSRVHFILSQKVLSSIPRTTREGSWGKLDSSWREKRGASCDHSKVLIKPFPSTKEASTSWVSYFQENKFEKWFCPSTSCPLIFTHIEMEKKENALVFLNL